MTVKQKRSLWWVLGTIVAIAIISGGYFFMTGSGFDSPAAANGNTSPSASASSSPSASAECIKVVPANSKDNRFFSDGIVEIKNATDEKSAQQAFNVWLDEVLKTPAYMAPTIKTFLGEDVDQASLVDGDCVSAKALEYDARLRAESIEWTFAPEAAPSNGYNTGVQDGQVVRSETPGITGDLTAIKITLPDGTVVWILCRCGNIVTIEQPPLPPGKTDNPPRPTPEKPCPMTEKPSGGPFEWNPETCAWYKPVQSFDEQQNQGPAVQAPQDNSTVEESGVNTGKTPGAPATAPTPKPEYTPPTSGSDTPAPPPVSGGSDSGGGAGTAPGGTTTDPGGSTSSGEQPGTSDPDDTEQGGDNGIGDDDGVIVQPDW